MSITFIAEIGMNHNGNFGLLHELIKQAAQSKANIAKFQLGWRDGPEEINNINDDTIELILKLCEFSLQSLKLHCIFVLLIWQASHV